MIIDSVYSKNRQINKIQVGQKTVDFIIDTGSCEIVLLNSIFKSLNCNSLIKLTHKFNFRSI